MKNILLIFILLFFSTQVIFGESLYGTLSDGRSIKLDSGSMKWEFYTGTPEGKISVKFVEFRESRVNNCNTIFEVTNFTKLHF